MFGIVSDADVSRVCLCASTWLSIYFYMDAVVGAFAVQVCLQHIVQDSLNFFDDASSIELVNLPTSACFAADQVQFEHECVLLNGWKLDAVPAYVNSAQRRQIHTNVGKREKSWGTLGVLCGSSSSLRMHMYMLGDPSTATQTKDFIFRMGFILISNAVEFCLCFMSSFSLYVSYRF